MSTRTLLPLVLVLAACSPHDAAHVPGPTGSAPTPSTLSGAHVRSQDPSDVAAWGSWRGRPSDVTTDYVPDVTWRSIAQPAKLAHSWTGQQVHVVYSVPAWPVTGGDLAKGAAGDYDHYYRSFAETLVKAGQGSQTLRFAWEFNGLTYGWSVHNDREALLYAKMWKRFVTAVRQVPGAAFRFDWCISNNALDRFALETAYPGDEYVDIIGDDVYDWDFANPSASADERWQDLRAQNGSGLDWQAAFALQHDKSLGFAEWASAVREFEGQAVGGGDRPTFIDQMHAWFASHNTAYEVYFTSDFPAKPELHDLRDGHFPQAGARYRAVFGKP